MPHARPASRRLRVAFSIDNMQIGGTELNAVRTAERLDRSRFELSVVCLQEHGPLLDRYAAAGIEVHAFPIPRLYGPEAARQGMRLMRFLRRRGIDVLHAHDIYSNAFSVPWARLAGVRTIASRRWWEALPGAAWGLTSRLSYRLAHAVLANSPRVAELLTVREGVARERIVVVPNFVDDDAFVPVTGDELLRERVTLGIDTGDRVVGVVANLSPVKDHESLLRAVALLRPRWPTLRLVLVGDGECRAALEELARTLRIDDRVTFAGRRSPKRNLHHLFEISVLPSVSEGLPNSILEAMAAGRPVVATEVGALPDAVVDGETGVLVPTRRPDRLAGAIESLLADPRGAESLGAAARRRASEHFSASAALSSLERLYEDLVGQPGDPRGIPAVPPAPLPVQP